MAKGQYLKTTAAIAILFAIASLSFSCGVLTGVSGTAEAPEGSYSMEGNTVTLDLAKAGSTLYDKGSVKFSFGEGENKLKIIVVVLSGGSLKAYENRCTRGRGELEYKGGLQILQCVSLSGSKYDLDGKVISGPAGSPVRVFETKQKDDKLIIKI